MVDRFVDEMSLLENLETKAQLAFIKDVFSANLPVRLWGGYADDALLSGRVSRLHHDVDLAAMRSDTDFLELELTKRGYTVTQEAFGKSDRPYKLLVKGKNIIADIALFDKDEHGIPIIDILYSKTGTRYRVSFDEDMFDSRQCELESINVTVVSPLSLIRSKDAYFQAGVASSRPKDVAGKAALLKKFFPGEDPDSEKFKLRVMRG